MKIAFVLSGLTAGGAEKIVNLLAHHRSDQGDTVSILAVNAADTQSYYPYAPHIGIETLGARRASSLSTASLRLLQLRRKLRALEPDLVVAFLTKVNALVGLATLGLKTPIVMSERNNFLLQRKNPLWRLISPIAARKAVCLVMQTEDARAALPAALRSRAMVIPNPVTLPNGIVPIPDEKMRIIAAGRLDKQKGFDLLLQAFRSVADDLATVTLTIFGEGPERQALERQARDLGLTERVSMPGVTTSPAEWISKGDVFVLSSRFEGFPNVLLEALAAGIPTVAFDCPWGPSDILKNEVGLLIPPGDVVQLGNAMRRLVADAALRCKLAEAGPAVSARYSKASVLAQWDEVIFRATRFRSVIPLAPGGHTAGQCRTCS
ncbi:glycosyltransferase family 4 protein [Chelativorans salis]|uniref:Glycosyltransferase family 4 protein n=1 Tax=Chelativorans salis TaxID=2978478 RepID=A0ABT2LU93_9HYPH|nr:glycosyltransferase family 4 protein [Chelativorans sp. EGI FJ00035]MCT7376938.1 glycosyltransferase family 4 protein [Chelativorans sp. EGI FJ00035]